VTVYVTVSMRIVVNERGGLAIVPESAAVGALPLPVETAGRRFGIGRIDVLDPRETGVTIEECILEEGRAMVSLVSHLDDFDASILPEGSTQ
jgi:hypothetical protein